MGVRDPRGSPPLVTRWRTHQLNLQPRAQGLLQPGFQLAAGRAGPVHGARAVIATTGIESSQGLHRPRQLLDLDGQPPTLRVVVSVDGICDQPLDLVRIGKLTASAARRSVLHRAVQLMHFSLH